MRRKTRPTSAFLSPSLLRLIAAALAAIAAMAPPRLDAQPTPLGPLELAAVLRDGHHAEFGAFPSTRRLRIAWAHVALENGRGAKTWHWNLGMIGASRAEPHFLIGGHRFAANGDAIDGARLYWRTLRRMCRGSLPYFDAGDARGAAGALTRCGWHRTDPTHYATSMATLSNLAPQP